MVLTSPKENNRPAVHITYTEIISLSVLGIICPDDSNRTEK